MQCTPTQLLRTEALVLAPKKRWKGAGTTRAPRKVMRSTVREFMNAKLVYLREGDRTEIAKKPILDFGITAVPVLDDSHRPVGIVSLRDLVDPPGREGAHVREPVVSIAVDAPIATAAQVLAETNVHHLVVVDIEGKAVGMISALDVLRALVGLAPKHPRRIETFDPPISSRPPARD
jgi:CBS domain-containing protein